MLKSVFRDVFYSEKNIPESLTFPIGVDLFSNLLIGILVYHSLGKTVEKGFSFYVSLIYECPYFYCKVFSWGNQVKNVYEYWDSIVYLLFDAFFFLVP